MDTDIGSESSAFICVHLWFQSSLRSLYSLEHELRGALAREGQVVDLRADLQRHDFAGGGGGQLLGGGADRERERRTLERPAPFEGEQLVVGAVDAGADLEGLVGFEVQRG